MVASTLLLLAAMCQDDGAEFWKFQPGTEWVYTQSDGGNRKTTKMKVKEQKDGKTICESADYDEGSEEPDKIETVALYVKDGLMRFAMIENDETRDLFVVLKIGGKKGDKWKSGLIEGQPDADVEHLGTEDVVVNKGSKEEKTYSGAVHTKLTFSMDQQGMKVDISADYFFVKNVGLVKMVMKSSAGGQANEMNLDLREFKAAK